MNDTIAAIATASGAGGVGVVRVSGPESLAIARQFFGKLPQHRYAHFARFRDQHGQEIDHGLLLYFQKPHSFTGEDVLELQAHGSPIALSLLLKRCIELGARPARAGEFTERAFLNHKLDLAQAEAVADLIAAQSEAAAMAAVRSLDGEFSRRVEQVRQDLTDLRTYIEALIDFPDEEIDFSHDQQIAQRCTRLQSLLAHLLAQTQQGQRLRDGLYVVIVGPPNAGKSSLLNALAQADRAIVTPIAGTTRDVLREHITLNGVPVTLVDTAGLRDSPDLIEAEGIRRAHAEFTRADLALVLLAADQNECTFAEIEASLPSALKRLRVRNKSDLLPAESPSEADALTISSRTGAGLQALGDAILSATQSATSESSQGSFSARARHVQGLQQVLTHLGTAQQWLQSAQGELAAEELRLAQLALSELTGAFSADDLLGQIFSAFCIGK
jgi:tRNA modification GTPase